MARETFIIGLVLAQVLGIGACDGNEGPGEEPGSPIGDIPLALDRNGQPRIWQNCGLPFIELEVLTPEKARSEVHRAALAAVESWKVPGIPRLKLRFIPAHRAVLREDGRSQVMISDGRHLCRESSMCPKTDWLGLTRHYGTSQDMYSNTIEADIWLHESLLNSPTELQSVLLHELGHLMGLDHPREMLEKDDSIMSPDIEVVATSPGGKDVVTLKKLYAKCREPSE